MKNKFLDSQKQKKSKSVILTISILISKRPDTVRKCLNSIKPILEAVSTELILTDTGCGEEVRKIIEEYTDHIIDFTWCHDFSKARNAGLKQAKGEWFLFLDDDEWFDDVSEIIDFFNSGDYKNYGLAVYSQRNYIDETGTSYKDSAVGRMIKLEKNICFQYAIHECFNRISGKTKVLKAFVHHYGYVYKTREELLVHFERNVSLLLKEQEKDHANLKHTIQLIQEYNAVEDYNSSLKLSLNKIEYSKHHEMKYPLYRSSIFVNVINCYFMQDDLEKLIEVGKRYLEQERLDELAKSMIYYRMAAACFENQDYLSVLQYTEEYCKRYEMQKGKSDIFLAYTTNITSATFQMKNPGIAVCMAIWACIAVGKYEDAALWFGKIDMDKSFLSIWNKSVRQFWNKVPMNSILCFHEWVKNNLLKEEVYYLAWNRSYFHEDIKIRAEKILKGILTEEDMKEIVQKIREYSEYSVCLYSKIYESEAENLNMEEFSQEAKAGFLLKDWEQYMMQGQYGKVVECLKLIVGLMPDWIPVVKVCLKSMEILIKRDSVVKEV